MALLWLKHGDKAPISFFVNSDGKFKLKGDGSVCEKFGLDPSTVEISNIVVPCTANGWTEATVADLGFIGTTQQTPLLVTGAAAGPGPNSSLAMDVDQVISKAVSQALEAYDAKCNPRSVAFSKVGESVAFQVYTANHVTIIDGNVFAPLPSNTLPPCGVFDMASYADEARALPTLQQHIQHGLEMNGVSFQRGGFTLADVHESTILILPHNNNTYKGGVDMAIVPYGVHASSLGQWRAAVEVKHSAKHKALYREKHGGPPAVGNESDVQLTGAAMGQSLMEVLSAFVYSEWPQFALLWTSVDSNAVMVLSAGQLYLWKELSFDAAMWKLAEYLKNCDSMDRKYSLEAHRNVVPEEEFNEAERLRKRLKVQSMVAEQLASLDPFVTDPYERFCLARQLIHEAAPTSMYI